MSNLSTHHDSTAVTRAAQKMFSEFSADVAFILSCEGLIEHATDNSTNLLAPESSLKGQQVFDYLTPQSADLLKDALAAVSEGDTSIQVLELEFKGADASSSAHIYARVFYDHVACHRWLIGSNVSELKAREEALLQRANLDPLTGLPNRSRLTSYLQAHLDEVQKRGGAFATLAIDLDGFKKINDAVGHHAGDLLLVEVAKRISTVVRKEDLVSRLGGDEFMLILSDLCTEEEARKISKRILAELNRPYFIEGNQLFVSGSIGIAMYPQDGEAAYELMQNADHALYKAKYLGKNSLQMYTPELKESCVNHVALDSAMNEAIHGGEFSLYYQPLVDVTGKLVGAEALMRWRRPDGTMIPPSDFIPVAETNGLISLLGDYALRVSAMQLRRFQEAGLKNLYMSVNVSPRQLRQEDFVRNLKRILEITDIDPSHIVLELTESILMHEQQKTQTLLRKIADTGVRLSVDDFGTGYSCLAYLKSYPISALKIDRSFITELETDAVSRPIVKAILDLASALNMGTVIEGVETEEQAQILRGLNATCLQGYLYGRPMPADEFIEKYKRD